jgi:signal peptidase I
MKPLASNNFLSKIIKRWKPDQTKPKKSKVREWWDAILFAVIAATLIRWLIMEPYVIPTPSMENSLLVGDFLFVSKFHYGTRTTSTPLQVPLSHQKIWFTNIPSYLEWIKLPNYRLPGLSSVKNGDIVVFNVPGIEENNFENPDPSTWVDPPVDLKTNYVKRCIAIAGDSLLIRNKKIFINNKEMQDPAGLQYSYLLTCTDMLKDRVMEKLEIGKEDIKSAGWIDKSYVYNVCLTEDKVNNIKSQKLPYIKSLATNVLEETTTVFPHFHSEHQDKYYLDWTDENFGPLWIPKKGVTIPINDSTLELYGKTIVKYDLNNNAKIDDGKLYLDDKIVSEYTFKQNYYFMMGDNRTNSLDSRFWGFVPADHIVGKALFIWMSTDKDAGLLYKIRWQRLFSRIK